MPKVHLLTTLQILREVNLAAIRRDAEGPFTLHLLGPEPQATALAEALCGGEPVHPWIQRSPWPPAELPEPIGPELAILILARPEASGDEAEALLRLRGARVPTLAVVMTDEPVDPAVAGLVRPGEGARVLLPAEPYPTVLRARLVPALLALAAERDPELPLALARQLVLLREPYVHRLIEDVSRGNAVYATSTGLAELVPGLAVPLTATDVIILTKNQLVMAYKIALANGKTGSARSVMAEMLGVLGGGLVFRQIARELIGLVPLFGLVPKIAVAYGGTVVIGRAAHVYTTEGRVLQSSELRQLYDAAIHAGRVLAEEVVARLPERDGRALAEPGRLTEGPP
jgi:uncharacterized protein (DUF697 family)